jgi:hypothetical protein
MGAGRQICSGATLSCRHGPACPGHLSRHVLDQVARTRRAMTGKEKIYVPHSTILMPMGFGPATRGLCRLQHREGPASRSESSDLIDLYVTPGGEVRRYSAPGQLNLSNPRNPS